MWFFVVWLLVLCCCFCGLVFWYMLFLSGWSWRSLLVLGVLGRCIVLFGRVRRWLWRWCVRIWSRMWWWLLRVCGVRFGFLLCCGILILLSCVVCVCSSCIFVWCWSLFVVECLIECWLLLMLFWICVCLVFVVCVVFFCMCWLIGLCR